MYTERTTRPEKGSYECDIHSEGSQASGDGQHAVVNVEPVAKDRRRHEHPDNVD